MTFNRTLSLRSAIVALSFSAFQVQAADGGVDLTSEQNQISYSIGVNIGQNLQGQGIMDSVNLEAFFEGITDVIAGEPKLTMEQMMTALQSFQQQLADEQAAADAATLAESEAFLAANAQVDGVVTTASGLQYQVLASGDAAGTSPTLEDSVLAHYHGTFIDGTVFDSSVERGEPAEFGVSQVIAGWTEALQLMKKGDKWKLFIPSALAYGEMGSGPIGPHSTLVFEVELLQINGQ
jgi:FKBP-type peptidyl-prolyl cis-trans isomerase FklB